MSLDSWPSVKTLTAVAAGVAIVVGAVIAILWLAGVFDKDEPEPGPLEIIGQRAGYGSYKTWRECDIVVIHPSPTVRLDWPMADDTAVIACENPGGFAAGTMEYAHFADSEALEDALAQGHPTRRYCTFASTLVIEVIAPRFAQMCATYGGHLAKRGG